MTVRLMNMKTIVTVLLIALFAATTLAGEKIKSDAEWLKMKHKQLAAVKDPAKVKSVGLWTSGDKRADGQYGYFPKGDGLILFEDKTWVLIVSHSMHAEDGLSDLTLIRASDGKHYVNKGHVCDKLILDAPEKIISLESFLKAKGKGSKAEPTEWKEYKGEPTPPRDVAARAAHEE